MSFGLHSRRCYVRWLTYGAGVVLVAQTQPDNEGSYGVVAIGASAGGLEALRGIFEHLPAAFGIPIVLVHHLPNCGVSNLTLVLGRWTNLTVKWAEHGEALCGGKVYVAPINHHVTVTDEQKLDLCCLSDRVNNFRPAVDPLFYSVARVFRERAISIVLSGMLADGSRGTAEVRRWGGVAMAQSKATSRFFDMPCAAMDYGGCELRFSPLKIAEALGALGDRPFVLQ